MGKRPSERAAWVSVVMVVAACHAHGPALPPIPGQGGPPWFELQSEHFTLWTDGSKSQAQQLIRQMEHLRQVVLGVGFSSGNAEGRNLVIALRDVDETNVFVPPQFAAYASSGGPIRQPMIVLPIDAPYELAPIVTHELTHVISYNVIRHQPPWFAEGLANFFATVNLDPDKAEGDFGKPLDYIIARLHKEPPTHTASMFACRERACKDDRFYASAWAMFSFLANTYPQQLLRYAARLDQLTEQTMDQAWAEVFPTLTPDQFDRELRDWLGHGRHTVWQFKVRLQDWPVTERPLHDADVLAARAVMRMMFAKLGDRPPPDLAEAIAADPSNLLAHLVKDRYKSISIDEAHRVAEAHADDWRAWWLLAKAADWKGDDGRTAREHACALVTAHPTGWAPTEWCVNR